MTFYFPNGYQVSLVPLTEPFTKPFLSFDVVGNAVRTAILKGTARCTFPLITQDVARLSKTIVDVASACAATYTPEHLFCTTSIFLVIEKGRSMKEAIKVCQNIHNSPPLCWFINPGEKQHVILAYTKEFMDTAAENNYFLERYVYHTRNKFQKTWHRDISPNFFFSDAIDFNESAVFELYGQVEKRLTFVHMSSSIIQSQKTHARLRKTYIIQLEPQMYREMVDLFSSVLPHSHITVPAVERVALIDSIIMFTKDKNDTLPEAAEKHRQIHKNGAFAKFGIPPSCAPQYVIELCSALGPGDSVSSTSFLPWLKSSRVISSNTTVELQKDESVKATPKKKPPVEVAIEAIKQKIPVQISEKKEQTDAQKGAVKKIEPKILIDIPENVKPAQPIYPFPQNNAERFVNTQQGQYLPPDNFDRLLKNESLNSDSQLNPKAKKFKANPKTFPQNEDMETILGEGELNDYHINTFMQATFDEIENGSRFFSDKTKNKIILPLTSNVLLNPKAILNLNRRLTFFKKRYNPATTESVHLLIPGNIPNFHWYLYHVVYKKNSTTIEINVYDSLPFSKKSQTQVKKDIPNFAAIIQNMQITENKSFNLITKFKDGGYKQQDATSCGVAVCLNVDLLVDMLLWGNKDLLRQDLDKANIKSRREFIYEKNNAYLLRKKSASTITDKNSLKNQVEVKENTQISDKPSTIPAEPSLTPQLNQKHEIFSRQENILKKYSGQYVLTNEADNLLSTGTYLKDAVINYLRGRNFTEVEQNQLDAIKSEKFKTVDVDGDGSCYYRALLIQLEEYEYENNGNTFDQKLETLKTELTSKTKYDFQDKDMGFQLPNYEDWGGDQYQHLLVAHIYNVNVLVLQVFYNEQNKRYELKVATVFFHNHFDGKNLKKQVGESFEDVKQKERSLENQYYDANKRPWVYIVNLPKPKTQTPFHYVAAVPTVCTPTFANACFQMNTIPCNALQSLFYDHLRQRFEYLTLFCQSKVAQSTITKVVFAAQGDDVKNHQTSICGLNGNAYRQFESAQKLNDYYYVKTLINCLVRKFVFDIQPLIPIEFGEVSATQAIESRGSVVQVWGANVSNWDNKCDEDISGAGQAAALKKQYKNVFGIVSTLYEPTLQSFLKTYRALHVHLVKDKNIWTSKVENFKELRDSNDDDAWSKTMQGLYECGLDDLSSSKTQA